jgi:uncharacterized protein with von Willebrand factor type A (vWA) domain
MRAEQQNILDASAVGELALSQLADFTRVLRVNAFTIGLKESEDAARVLASAAGTRAVTLRAALKALFCARRSDWNKFDTLFDAHWLRPGVRRVVKMTPHARASATATARPAQGPEARRAHAPGIGELTSGRNSGPLEKPGEARGRMEGASRAEHLAETDFRKIADPQAIAEAHALAARLAKKMRSRLTRRKRAQRKRARLDMRRTIRRNICHGGVPIDLMWRSRKPKPLRLVLLLDVSGSMSLYTSVFVRFMHGVLDHFREAEAFLFHTRLAHVSAAMREKDVGRALERLSLLAQGAGGGTRIGESLATFNRWHAPTVMHSRTCVLIISDGYDTGPAGALAAEMRRLKRRCRRIVWLNPMLGWEGYQPIAQGMQAALPYLDLFAPAHNLRSLAALEPYLARL